MILITSFLLIILLIGIVYLHQNKIIESFIDINPITDSNAPSVDQRYRNCTPGTTCNDENSNIGFGIYNSECYCISSISNTEYRDQLENNQEEEQNNYSPSESGSGSGSGLGLGLELGLGLGLGSGSGSGSGLGLDLPQDCYPNKSNLDEICRKQNINYGIKKLIPCDNNHSKVECGLNYLNGVHYGDNVTITPCLNKSDDFDSWCRYYNNVSNIPIGYNVNSIGANKILVGASGGCYTNDGKSDNNNARGICDYKHIEQIPRLEPANNKINYNIYTDCLPLNGNNFISSCNNLVKNKPVYATQIMGYDCNPGYGRAKCLLTADQQSFDINFYNKYYDSEYYIAHTDLNTSCTEQCT